ncbi:SKA2 protein, partial [Heliornis fulica]|nr:SKA2 protein [Heliornis fulica]
FQKIQSDLDYIHHRLEFEIMKSLPDDPSPEENPLALLEAISAVKSRYKTLCMELEEVFRERRECMQAIHVALGNTMRMTQALQQSTDLK